MTFRNREDHMPASEEFTSYLPGSFLYCHPSQVESWNQSVQYGEFALPTPPDSSSDCGTIDSQDMTSQSWSQASQPEEWTAAPAQEFGTYPQPSAHGWPSSGMPMTTQDVQTMDTAAWLSASSGPVSQGLSPVPSHESRSTRTLNSFSEPDACVLPPGLDLSFAAEPCWNPSGHAAYFQSPAAVYPSEQPFVQALPYTGKPDGSAPFHQMHCPATSPPMFLAQGGHNAYPQRTAYPALAPKRQLLPRTEGSPQSVQAAHGPHRVLRPYVQGPRESHASFPSVSNTAAQPAEGFRHTAAQVGHGSTHHSMPPSTQEYQVAAMRQPAVTSQTNAPGTYIMDPTVQDFSDFIQYDQEDYNAAPAQMSYNPEYDVRSILSAGLDTQQSVPLPEQDALVAYQGASSVNSSLATESDEGRHRNHPLYVAEPQEDGLFHCPYKAKDPHCPHKPTKLKCNYDKYIDSHLKPFRCKIETCVKQEFSSTACLLRHEREAHGMHGHGDRPHLCFYTGCERGIPGNGFPRRYNLYDHMKRVHDHKGDPRAGTRSPSVSNSQDKKAAASRKRKASDSDPVEQAAQRQRIMPVSAQPQVVFAPQVYANQPQEYFQEPCYAVPPARKHQAQQRVYHHWANQRDLIERQMGSVQSPEDVAGLQRLTQNVEEFRRLSEVVRRG